MSPRQLCATAATRRSIPAGLLSVCWDTKECCVKSLASFTTLRSDERRMSRRVTVSGRDVMGSVTGVTEVLRRCVMGLVTDVKPCLTLFSKAAGCSLCDEAKEVLKPFKHRCEFREVDITLPGNKAWWRKYRYDIPVLHLNDKFLMKHRVNEQLLELSLAEWERYKS